MIIFVFLLWLDRCVTCSEICVCPARCSAFAFINTEMEDFLQVYDEHLKSFNTKLLIGTWKVIVVYNYIFVPY